MLINDIYRDDNYDKTLAELDLKDSCNITIKEHPSCKTQLQ